MQSKLDVRLVRHTPMPESVIAAAAKLCYAENIDDKFDSTLYGKGGDTEKFVGILKRMGHHSPLEHASFTFFIQGVSRALTHQLVRHRVASYSQRSQRYVKHDEFDYVIPPQFEGKTVDDDGTPCDAVEYYKDTMAMIADRYSKLNAALGNTGEKSNEDARYVLPNACETKIFVTMNARELLHFFEERLCNRAQWEIRELANAMLAIVKEVCPSVFSGCGPKCLSKGKCPEGKMTCGKFNEMIKKYGKSGDKK